MDALWSWPLTALILLVLIPFLEMQHFAFQLFRNHTIFYVVVGGIISGLIIGIGVRRGYRLVCSSNESNSC